MRERERETEREGERERDGGVTEKAREGKREIKRVCMCSQRVFQWCLEELYKVRFFPSSFQNGWAKWGRETSLLFAQTTLQTISREKSTGACHHVLQIQAEILKRPKQK